MLQCCKSINL